MPQRRLVRVYLLGPITGSSRRAIETWRHIAARQLAKFAEVVDPSSYRYDSTIAYVTNETPDQQLGRLQHGHFVVERNKALIRNSDFILANFLEGAQRASIGSIGEIFLAYALEKPVIIVRQEHGNVHDHAMLNAIATKVCYSLEDAVAALGELAGLPRHTRRSKTADLTERVS